MSGHVCRHNFVTLYENVCGLCVHVATHRRVAWSGSPYWLLTEHLSTHKLVEIYPKVAVGVAVHLATHDLFACTSPNKPVVDELHEDTHILMFPET